MPLRFFAVRHIGETPAADDIIQECFINLWEKRREFRDGNLVRFYLYQSVRNACLNVIRHRKVRDRFTASRENAADGDDSFMEKYLEAETMQLIMEAIDELPAAMRSVYKLTLEGLSREEIGEKLGITVNTVKKQRSNAQQMIREKLKNVLSVIPLLP